MPIFGNKFSPKKTPARKSNSNSNTEIEDLVTDRRIINLKLGEQEVLFENGEWIPKSGKNNSTYKTNQKLKRKIQELEEENNLLRVKYEIMLNMLTEATSESHIQERELQSLKRQIKKSEP